MQATLTIFYQFICSWNHPLRGHIIHPLPRGWVKLIKKSLSLLKSRCVLFSLIIDTKHKKLYFFPGAKDKKKWSQTEVEHKSNSAAGFKKFSWEMYEACWRRGCLILRHGLLRGLQRVLWPSGGWRLRGLPDAGKSHSSHPLSWLHHCCRGKKQTQRLIQSSQLAPAIAPAFIKQNH